MPRGDGECDDDDCKTKRSILNPALKPFVFISR